MKGSGMKDWRPIFRQREVGSNLYVDESNRYLIERSFEDGPRGGKRQMWHLYELRDDRWHPLGRERRLRDLFALLKAKS